MKKIIIMLLTMCLLASCGGNTAATVGGIKITENEFEFYLNSIKNQMKGTELQTEEDWETREIEGKKAIDVAKQRVTDIAVQDALYIETAKAAGLDLSAEEKKSVSATKQQLIEGYGGKSAYKDFLKSNNITDKFIERMCESAVYYQKIGGIVKEDNEIGETEMMKYYEENKLALETEYRKAKHILIMTVDDKTRMPKSDEEIAMVENLANELYAKIKAGADFDKLMHEYSQDPGLETSPGGYVFASGEMVSEFEQAVDSVGFGEFALCKSSYGYHIIKRLPLEYSDISDKLADKILEERIEEQVDSWKEEYSVKVTKNEKVISDIK